MSVPAASADLQLLQVSALLETDPPGAVQAARQILKAHPGHLAASLMLASAQRLAGDATAATAVLRQLATQHASSGVIQLELARALATADAEQAGCALKRAVELEPQLAEAWRELAMYHAARGEDLAGDVAYANFTRLVPEEDQLVDARAALATRRFDTAATLLNRYLGQSAGNVVALRLLAALVYERGDPPQAERILLECLRRAPGYSRARVDLVGVLHARQKAADILPHVDRLLALEPGNLRYRTSLAGALTLLGQTERSSEILVGLIKEQPQDAKLWLWHAHNLRTAGRPTEAIAGYHKSVQLDPQFGEAWFSLANLKTYRFSAEEIADMRAQVARPELADEHRVQFEFALGKALEDAREYEEAFAHYARGNSLRRAAVPYSADKTSAFVRRSKALYVREFLAARAGWGNPSREPIFIIGLPRAGSTLIEQVLASHSQVEGTRELPDIQGFCVELGARSLGDAEAAYPQSVAQLSDQAVARFGERYLEQTRPLRVTNRPFFIDKMGDNFRHVGLIHLILPNARIIDARRAPMGCCFSNFKQLYQEGGWYSYDLTDMGRYYRDYVELTAHWDAVLPGRVHRVNYEAMIADLEGEVRRLLSYCGLPFEEQCLRFHQTERAVQTASSEQVRRPLYTESLEQWRNFEPWLGPLRSALGDLAT